MRRIVTGKDARRLADSARNMVLLDASAPGVPAADGSIRKQTVVVPESKPDGYTATLIKLIPSEVVAIFVTLDSIIRSNGKLAPLVYWIIFLILMIATYFYMRRITQVGGLQPRRSQAVIASISFLVWVFAIGGPFTYAKLDWYDPVYGAIGLPLYTFLMPLFFPKFNK
jgi:hypothetical protein